MDGAGDQIYWGEEKAVEGWGTGAGARGGSSDSGRSSWKNSAWRYCQRRRLPSHCRAEGGKQSGVRPRLGQSPGHALVPRPTPRSLTELLTIFSSKGCQLTSRTQALWLVSFFTMWPLRRSYTVQGRPEWRRGSQGTF